MSTSNSTRGPPVGSRNVHRRVARRAVLWSQTRARFRCAQPSHDLLLPPSLPYVGGAANTPKIGVAITALSALALGLTPTSAAPAAQAPPPVLAGPSSTVAAPSPAGVARALAGPLAD